MVAPVCVRNFAAVEVATVDNTYYLNLARLEFAIELLRKISENGIKISAAVEFYRQYPTVTPSETWDYIQAAQACFEHEVKP